MKIVRSGGLLVQYEPCPFCRSMSIFTSCPKQNRPKENTRFFQAGEISLSNLKDGYNLPRRIGQIYRTANINIKVSCHSFQNSVNIVAVGSNSNSLSRPNNNARHLPHSQVLSVIREIQSFTGNGLIGGVVDFKPTAVCGIDCTDVEVIGGDIGVGNLRKHHIRKEL